MSRTDKDRPHWVRVHDQYEITEVHHWHELRYRRGDFDGAVCELDKFDNDPLPRENRWMYACHRAIPYWAPGGHEYYGNTPRWFLEHYAHNPERTRERTQLREAVKEANAALAAGDEFDDFDFPCFQQRHSARRIFW